MNASKIILTITAVMLTIGIAGCKKKEQPAVSNAPAMEGMMKQAADVNADANKAAAETAAPGEQTLCPVTGGEIDKNVFVEYKGKKVYFCCAACKGPFEKNPEKYMAKLPQFVK
jgi:YHS domain-containing protein